MVAGAPRRGSPLRRRPRPGTTLDAGDLAITELETPQQQEEQVYHLTPDAGNAASGPTVDNQPAMVHGEGAVIVAARDAGQRSRTAPTPRLLRKMRKEAQAGPLSTDAFVVRSKRKVRSGSRLDSEEAGELQIGTIVRVLDRIELSDGTQRARVAKLGPREDGTPLGWISCIGSRDESDALVAFHWMRFQRTTQVERPDCLQKRRMSSTGAGIERAARGSSRRPARGRR